MNTVNIVKSLRKRVNNLKSSASKPNLLIVSHVLPFPGSTGQQQRVSYTLKHLRQRFTLTFLTCTAPARAREIEKRLSVFCDDIILLPQRYARGPLAGCFDRFRGLLFVARTGLKLSNFAIGRVDYSPLRVARAVAARHFDGVLYEYWHAVDSVAVFRERGIPCVLDMHNILWQSYAQQLRENKLAPTGWKTRSLACYRTREEQAWNRFNALIAINQAERCYAQAHVPREIPVFYAPMGTDLRDWPYSWNPAHPPRLAYYGGLGSSHNQQAALSCVNDIMPIVWQRRPQTEFWIIGSDPPPRIRALANDPRVRVTGFLPRPQEILHTMTCVFCPWSGTYGFRSRLVEVMALGIPVAASTDAVHGMDLEHGQGILLLNSTGEMARHGLNLIADQTFAADQSQLARHSVEKYYNSDKSYGGLATDLWELIQQHSGRQSAQTAEARA